MAANDNLNDIRGRLKALENQASRTSTKVEGPAVTVNPITPWIPGIAVLVALLGVGTPVAIHLNTRIDLVKTDVSSLSTKVDKLSSAVLTLTNQQSQSTQNLIHSLLAAADISKDPQVATRATLTAAALTEDLTHTGVKSSPDFFSASLNNASKITQSERPEVRTAGYTIQQKLANYRSAVEGANAPVDVKLIGGTQLNCEPNPPGKESAFGLPPMNATNLGLNHCRLQIDGVNWENIIVVNSAISYSGGPLRLKNVSFRKLHLRHQRKSA